MITEDRMRELLGSAASDVEAPAGGAERVLTAAGGDGEAFRPRTRRAGRLPVSVRRLAVAAAATVVLVAAGLAVTDGGEDRFARTAGEVASGGGGGGVDKGQSSDAGSLGRRYATTAPPSAAVPGAFKNAAGTGSTALATAGDLSRIVRTGSLTIEVTTGRFDAAVQAVTTVATGAGGLVADSRTSTDEEHRTGSVTIRVPADRFDAVVADLRQLGPVTRSETTADDVTAEYTDVEARLKALDTTRTAILTVLSQAKAVGDILAVQDRLNAVQTEIEQLQGRQRVLDDQTSLATVAVSLVEPGAALSDVTPAGRSSWEKAADGFTGTWSAVLSKSGTALATVLLVAALLALAILLARSTRRVYARLIA